MSSALQFILKNLFKLRNLSKDCARSQAFDELNDAACFKPKNLNLFGTQYVGGYHNPYLANANTTLSQARDGGFLIPIVKDNTGKVIAKDLFLPQFGKGFTPDCDIPQLAADALKHDAIEALAKDLQTTAGAGALVIGAGALAAVGALTGCSSKPAQDPDLVQELYDVFDAAQLEGEMDPVETLMRALRQAERDQKRKDKKNCENCKFEIVESGYGTRHSTTCGGPPADFSCSSCPGPGFCRPGYMELRKTCGNNPSTVVDRWLSRSGGPTRFWRNGIGYSQ